MEWVGVPQARCQRASPHRMSIQVPRLSIPNGVKCYRKCKSLPNIAPAATTNTSQQGCSLEESNDHHDEVLLPTSSSDTHCCAAVVLSDKKHGHNHHHQKPKILKKTWDKVKTIIHNPPLGYSSSSTRRESLRNKDKQQQQQAQSGGSRGASAPSTPLRPSVFDFDEGALVVQKQRDDEDDREKIKRNYALLQKRLSEELHQRMTECSKASEGSGGGGGSAGGGGSIGLGGHSSSSRLHHDHLSDEFKKRLQQWEMWKASTGKVHYTEEELQQIIPHEFSKKLLEWECIKHSHHHAAAADAEGGGVVEAANNNNKPVSSGSPKKARKKKVASGSGGGGEECSSSRHKELAWLEKQLEKIDGEKKRLEREMKKYLEREARLEKMKQAIKNSPDTDVYIKTPTAKCRVEKITEKFAKKIYEWEEKQGIMPESSALTLINPKYYDTSDNSNAQESEGVVAARDDGGEDADDEEVIGPLDLINARMGSKSQEETEQEILVRRAMDHVAEALAEADAEGRISSAASSCCCSGDYDDPTDSFATHEKNNSGASNTDSEFFKAEPRVRSTRRRSSDAISTPLSDARSPSLSAFTSDDEGDSAAGLLKTVSEENDDTVLHNNNNNVVKDAESQTEVILRAKPVVVEEEEEEVGGGGRVASSSQAVEGSSPPKCIVFVPTKRTIFTPILDEVDPDKVAVLIQQETVAQGGGNVVTVAQGGGNVVTVADTASDKECVVDSVVKPRVVGAIPKRPTNLDLKVQDNSSTPHHHHNHHQNVYKPQPKTQLNRSFPKMGKIPVWCSPLVARRQFSSTPQQPGPQQTTTPPLQIPIISTPDDNSDFSIDKFLQDSKLLDAAINTPTDDVGSSSGGGGGGGVSSSFQLQPPKRSVGSRLPKTNPLIPRKYTIGGGFPPSGGGGGGLGSRGALLTRSNSFGYQRGAEYGDNESCKRAAAARCFRGTMVQQGSSGILQGSTPGSQVSLNTSVGDADEDDDEMHYQASVMLHHNEPCSSVSMHSVTKSKSTGSIKSKFGRALARSFGFGKTTTNSSKKDDNSGGNSNSGAMPETGGGDERNNGRRPSGGQDHGVVVGSIRRLGSWIPKVGQPSSGANRE